MQSRFVAALLLAAITSVPALAADHYTQQIEQWRAERLTSLQKPAGWLSLIGLHWLKPGDNTVGSAADNKVVLAKGPAHLGTINLSPDGKLKLSLLPDSGALVDGRAQANVTLIDDTSEDQAPTDVGFGTVHFKVIERDGRKALRVTDSEAETRTKFLGLDYFPIAPAWRVTARWIAFDKTTILEIPNVLGTVDKEKVTGKAVFDYGGRHFELTPTVDDEDGSLFFVLADKTSGKETYGGARFLHIDQPKDGTVVLDFNKAYNPPCAFTPYATCPLAPRNNRLDVAVTAGEKNYRGAHH